MPLGIGVFGLGVGIVLDLPVASVTVIHSHTHTACCGCHHAGGYAGPLLSSTERRAPSAARRDMRRPPPQALPSGEGAQIAAPQLPPRVRALPARAVDRLPAEAPNRPRVIDAEWEEVAPRVAMRSLPPGPKAATPPPARPAPSRGSGSPSMSRRPAGKPPNVRA